ncbi:MAG: rhomboid family intramembrane serine protease [Bacteroidia bacterium]|nr:rhomboid family intramembrane serine protease [Bacteroidia bacterium]
MQNEFKKLSQASSWPMTLLGIQWVVKIIETVWQYNWFTYGIYPRSVAGLKGIVLAPFLHGDWIHLFDNSIPFLFLGTMLFYFYRHIAAETLIWIWLMGGLWTWIMARSSFHIGSSHIIYGLAAFIFFSGLFRKNLQLMSLSLLMVALYGGLIWGLLPIVEHISWEGHLMGAISGLLCAVYFKNYRTETENQTTLLADDVDESDPYWMEGYEPKPKEPEKPITIVYHFTDENKKRETD